MNKRPFIILSAFLLLFSLIEKGQAAETYRPETSVAGFIQLPGSGRQVYNFNPGWRFFRGDVRGAEAVNFDDRSWNVVSTPHTVPCCQHEANRMMENELLQPVLQYGILKERMAAIMTDAVRANLLTAKGYDTIPFMPRGASKDRSGGKSTSQPERWTGRLRT